MGQFADIASQALQGNSVGGSSLGFNPQLAHQQGSENVDALGAAGLGMVTGKGAANVPQPPPIKQVITSFDDQGNPSHDYKGISDQAHQFLQSLMQDGAQARASYDEAINRTAALRQAIDAHPLLHQIGRISAAYAANAIAPTPAGEFARAAAATAFDTLKEDPRQLAIEEARLNTAKLATQAPVMNAMDTQARIEQLKQYQAERERDRQQFRIEKGIREFDPLAKAGALTPEAIDARIEGNPDLKGLPQEQKDAIKQSVLDTQWGYRAADIRDRTLRQEDYKTRQKFESDLIIQRHGLEEESRRNERVALANIGNDRALSAKMQDNTARRGKLLDDYTQSIGIFQSAADLIGMKGGKLPPSVIRAKFLDEMRTGTMKVFADMDPKTQTQWVQTLNDAMGKIGAYVTEYPQLSKDNENTFKLMSREAKAQLNAPVPLPGNLAPALDPAMATASRTGNVPGAAAPAAPKGPLKPNFEYKSKTHPGKTFLTDANGFPPPGE